MYEVLIYTSFILIFTLVDVIGYWHILKGDPSHPYWEDKEYKEPNKLWYRIIQTIIQVGLFALIWHLTSVTIAILWIISHFFGIHDYLYYIFLGKYESMKSYEGEMYWLWWTIFGALFKNARNGKNLEIYSITNYIVTVLAILTL